MLYNAGAVILLRKNYDSPHLEFADAGLPVRMNVRYQQTLAIEVTLVRSQR